jgi:DNA-binding PadR family transcriptional regulator
MPRGNLRNAILLLLLERPMHGYEIIQQLVARTSGLWRPSPGAVYPALRRLQHDGLVTSDQVGKRLSFSLTDAGRAEASQQFGARPPWLEVADSVSPLALELRDAVSQIGWAVMHIATIGTADQCRQAAEILDHARRRLYLALAEE